MVITQEKFCSSLLEEVSEIEKECGVKTYAPKQTRFDSLIQHVRNVVNLSTPAITSESAKHCYNFLPVII